MNDFVLLFFFAIFLGSFRPAEFLSVDVGIIICRHLSSSDSLFMFASPGVERLSILQPPGCILSMNVEYLYSMINSPIST